MATSREHTAVTDNTSGTIEGAVNQDGHIAFIVAITSPASGEKDNYTGKLYADGHLEGSWQAEDVSRNAGSWNVS